ncbi:MAG: tail fiber domain-containing protein [Deltaproteobacteria bacterium]|nr:tail fiber domain-containing protein [Deltaproteobacteria bacterium]
MAKRFTFSTLALLAAALLAQPAAAAEVANSFIDAAGINIEPLVAHDGMTVRVSGPEGLVSEWYFGAGESATIFSSELGDGAYTWEASLFPRIDAATRRALAEARERGEDISSSLRAQGKLPTGPQSASGHFVVQGGAMVVDTDEQVGDGGPAGPASSPVTFDTNVGQSLEGLDNQSAAAQVIAQDLVVQGSICAGFDCTSGESFGFDTLRLKENNLRIKAQDTSTSASFPTNDWQITFNDTGNGGANKFSIDDIDGGRTPFTIEASAPSHSLYVDDGGRVGLGTATPVVELHVVNGDSPTIRLEQNGSSGFTPQTWDMAGNETNFFVRDATNGSRLPFKIRPSAPTNSIFVDTDGDVGLQDASPDARLDVEGVMLVDPGVLEIANSGNDALKLDVGTTSPTGTTLRVFSPDGSSGQFFAQAIDGGLVIIGARTNSNIAFRTNNNNDILRMTTSNRVGVNNPSPQHPLHVGTDATNGNGAHVTVAGIWVDASTRKNKHKIVDLQVDDALAALDEIQPVRYEGINDSTEEEYLGFIAEDVPDLVAMNHRKGLSAMDMAAMLTAVVKAQRETIQAMDARIQALEAAALAP